MQRWSKPVLDEANRRQLEKALRRRRREAMRYGHQADDQIERLLIRRFGRLVTVRRFVGLWSVLFILLFYVSVMQFRALSFYYQTSKPIPGGLYTSGIIGAFTNANPLYATGNADSSVSHLIFSPLFKSNHDNKLVGDLATGYKFDPQETRYTVSLRRDVTWQDGQPFTADDVVFTYKTIQNIETQSPLYSSWQNIVVAKQGPYIVTFDLPNPLSSFPYSLTNGIVPAHLLAHIPPGELRSAAFNTSPVGTGPFKWKFVEIVGGDLNRQQHIVLAPFEHYWAGRAKLDGFSLWTFRDDHQMTDAFNNKQINAMADLNFIPELSKDVQIYTTPLNNAVMAFFNNSRAALSDKLVRQALVSSINVQQLLNTLPYAANLVQEPLLRGQLGYNAGLRQLAYSPKFAKEQLDKAGWIVGKDGYRLKNGHKLILNLTSQENPEYTTVAQFLQKQWTDLGVLVNVRYLNAEDLQSTALPNHDYDVLVYGISIGTDPDIFAYWDSSQASINSQGHLNLSEYQSTDADRALESARTRSDQKLRALKYQNFLRAWAQDAPALALYQPDYIYITRKPVYGYGAKAFNSATDRFNNINNWMIRTQRQDR